MRIDFDKYSLIINNKRILVRSAALHYFRSPGLELWRDRLGKLKSCGYNAVDLYFCWGHHSKSEGIYDFTDIKDIRALLDLTVEMGLYVIARPGPFINAEVSAGGFPAWLLGKENVVLRNRKDGDFVYSKEYMSHVHDWYRRIIPIINEYHNIIAFQVENEYSTNEAEPDYIQALHDIAREMGVKAPIFHNDAYNAGLYSDIVNIYASDVYPVINTNQDWKENKYCFDTLDNLEDTFRACKENAPMFIAELQAGWFDKWGGSGYETIRKNFGKELINIVTKTALSQGVTMFNHYMGCGGTSWGNLACDEVYTSYDFAAPISEEGIPKENYYKAKEINYFLDSFDIAATDLIDDNDVILEKTQNIYTKLRRNPVNGNEWLFVRNLNDHNEEIVLKSGDKFVIKPYDMKIIPLNIDFQACRFDFSSVSLFSRIHGENREIVFVIAETGEKIRLSGVESSMVPGKIHMEKSGDTMELTVIDSGEDDLLSCEFKKGNKVTEIIFLTEETADKTWVFDNKALIGPDFLLCHKNKAAFQEETLNISIDPNVEGVRKIKEISVEIKAKHQELKNFRALKCSPETGNDYDFTGWNLVNSDMNCIANKVYDEFIWYKAKFTGHLSQIHINAKHCYSIYINGAMVYEHDSFYQDELSNIDELVTVNIKDEILKHENVITVLVQNLGFDKGFNTDLTAKRGIISFNTIPEKEMEWYTRGGLTPEIEEWDYIPIKDLEDSSKKPHLAYLTANFDFEICQNIYRPMYLKIDDPNIHRAIIYLNGYKIGHYWKEKSPQEKFYLIDTFLKKNNRITVVVWNKSQQIDDYIFKGNNVNIKIGHFAHFNTVDIDLLF